MPGRMTHMHAVQADNCVTENRSRYILGMYALIVSAGWYNEIVLSFMVVGESGTRVL